MKVRLKDIAVLTNLSITAVSVILNDPNTTRFPEVTKRKVLSAAEELNYVPNAIARSLVTNQTNVIGLVIPDLANPFFAELAKSIEITLREKGYTTLIVNSNDSYINDIELIKFLISRNVDGMILALSSDSFTNQEEYAKVLNTLNKPFILIDRKLDDKYGYSQISFDNRFGQYQATKYILNNNHSNVGYISARSFSKSGLDRYLGFIDAFEEMNIDVNLNNIVEGNYSFNTGYKNADMLFNNKVTAIICANDLIAYGVIKRAAELDLNIPKDISIVGYDDLAFNEMLNIGLSSVDQDTSSLASKAIEVLLKKLLNRSYEESYTLDPLLIKRESVANVD